MIPHPIGESWSGSGGGRKGEGQGEELAFRRFFIHFKHCTVRPIWSRYFDVGQILSICGINSIDDLESRSEVIWGHWFFLHQSKVHVWLPIGPQHRKLGPILPCFRDGAFVHRKLLFRYPTLIPAKISGCSPWSGHVMLFAKSKHPRLTNCEIIFEDFPPMWSQYLNVTDRQTDGWTICCSNIAFCIASCGKKSQKYNMSNIQEEAPLNHIWHISRCPRHNRPFSPVTSTSLFMLLSKWPIPSHWLAKALFW